MSLPTPSTRLLRAVLLLLGACLLATSIGRSATTVDTFDWPQAPVTGGSTSTQAGPMLGGARTLTPQTGAQASAGSGTLRLHRPTAGSGLVQAFWGGPAAVMTGLAGVTLNSGGDDAFLVGVASAQQAATLTLRVWTNAASTSSVTVAVVASTQPAYYRVAFSAFSGSANFANVGAVALELNAAAAGNTVLVDFLRTTKTSEAESVARLTDVVLVDANGDGRAGAGDTLRYFVTVKNTGATPMTNVQISATTPANTTATGGVAASPLARPVAPSGSSVPGDAWHAAFDTMYTRAAADGLLGGAFLGSPAATIASFGGGTLGGTVDGAAAGTTAVVDGHALQVNVDGSLTYLPKPGFAGLFTFQYRVSNFNGTSTATAQIAVGTRPAAKADTVTLVGNIAIQPNVTQGVVLSSGGAGADAGDAIKVVKFGKDAANVSTNPGVATVTEQGGALTVQADGSFVYNPPAGVTTDSFYYQVDNGFNAPSTAKVTLSASRRVWFIQSGAAVNGDGRLSTPFNTLAAFVGSAGYTAASVGDVVYFYSGSGYSGAYTVKTGQTLVGHSVALGSVVTLPVYSTPPATGAIPSWTGAQLTLPASGGASEIRGFSFTGTAGTILAGNGAGAVTLANLTLTPSVAASGLSLTSGTGALTATALTINGSGSGTAFRIVGGTYAISLDTPSAISQSDGGTALAINNHTGGTLAFPNPINASTGAGIALTNNTGTTISFTGTLTLSCGSNAAFSAIGGGTVTATDAANTVVVTTGPAVRVSNTSIGAAGLKFRSISADGSSSPAIDLANTGSMGGLTVTGTGAAASGGTIQNITGLAAISLTTTSGVSLSSMEVKNNSGSGIRADALAGLTLTNCTVQNCNINGSFDGSRSGFRADNLSGTCAFTNCTFADSKEDQIRIMPTAGTFSLTITGGTIGCTTRPAAGGIGLVLVASGSAAATVNLSNTTLANNYSSALLTSGGANSTQTINVSGCTFTNNWVGVDLAHDGTGDMTHKVLNSTLTYSLNTAIRAGTTTTTSSMVDVNGVFRGNTIGNSNADSGARDTYGLAIDIAGDANARVSVDHNTIQHSDVQGFYGESRLPFTTGGTGALDLTYLNNTVGVPDNNSASPYGTINGTLIEARNTRTVRLNIGTTSAADDNSSGGYGGTTGFRVRLRDTATFGIFEMPATTNVATVGTFIVARNAAGSTADATLASARTFTTATVALPSNN